VAQPAAARTATARILFVTFCIIANLSLSAAVKAVNDPFAQSANAANAVQRFFRLFHNRLLFAVVFSVSAESSLAVAQPCRNSTTRTINYTMGERIIFRKNPTADKGKT